jgi:dihydroorotase
MYDLVINNAKTIDNKTIDVAVQAGKLVAIAPQIKAEAKQKLDLKKKYYLSAGWIDGHVHCYEKMDLYYDYPDEIGIKKGVTTIVDAGSAGANNIADFYQLVQKATTNVYALLNISEDGIVTQDELADLSKINTDKIRTVRQKFADFIIGLKVRMSKTVVGNNGILPLDLAKQIQKENENLPLMVHIGSAPPELGEVLKRLEAGDIVTHCFNGKPNGILLENDQIKAQAWEAYNRGVIFDIGHGTDSFNFHVAEVAFQAGMKAQTISTDIYYRNREEGPVYDFATTLEKMLAVGYSLAEVIEKATIAPAENYRLSTKGRLEEGYDADLTIFELVDEAIVLTDSNGQQRTYKPQLKPRYTIIGGKVHDNEL